MSSVRRQPAAAGRRRMLTTVAATAVPPCLVALLALPFIIHQNAWWEWNTPYWLLQRQAAHVAAHGIPTPFVHTDMAAFNGFYLFYGGFLFSLLAYPAAVLGAWPVFAGASATALAAGYAGIWWTARNLGLSRRLAILPALTFSCTPYLLSDLYGRGAWTEFIAFNTAAVLLGGLTAILWQPQRRRGPALAALAGSAAILAGAHNVTLLMSALAFPLLIAALLPLVPRPDGWTGVARRLGVACAAIVVGAGLTGAWLIPNLWLGPKSYVATPDVNVPMLVDQSYLVTLSHLLRPWPGVPPQYGARFVYVQPPVLAMGWALLALLVVGWLRRRAPGAIMASGAALIALGAGLLTIITYQQWWLSFPRLLQTVQFQYRLVPYLAIATALAIAVVLSAAVRQGPRRLLIGTLVLVVAAQTAMAARLVVDSENVPHPGERNRDVRVQQPPASFASPDVIVQRQFSVVGRPIGAPSLDLNGSVRDNDLVAGDTITVRGKGAVGTPYAVPVVWSPLVRFGGDAQLSGRSGNGVAIVTVLRTDATGRWAATVGPKCATPCVNAVSGDAPWQMLAGQLLTLLSALAIAAAAVVMRRRRRQDPATVTAAAPLSAAAGPHRGPAVPSP